ncbi:SacI homology domain-containing protein [Hygrophoropsis aurantiaca]|uniref:SacI homology domain-containing protein n=1 Tax=Hygrophoropsis aurantiaca TaxID=72124 RepID=A0ACB8A6N0_9AGAM|nr:SacI homology domain-containing protein [Hygrophoropsis aurantiaca]
MKRLFGTKVKSGSPSRPQSQSQLQSQVQSSKRTQPMQTTTIIPSTIPNSTHAHTPTLHPKLTVPPLPHPRPYEHIALLATAEGLLLRPCIEGAGGSGSCILLRWGKNGVVEEVVDKAVYTGAAQTGASISADDSDATRNDWAKAVVVYGLVGMLELFNASYILVITSRVDIGHFLDAAHPVYGIKSVAAIPLVKDRAHVVLNRLAGAREPHPHPPANVSHEGEHEPAHAPRAGPHVTFAEEGLEDVKVLTPLDPDFSFGSNASSRPSSRVSSRASSRASSHTLTAKFAESLGVWGKRVGVTRTGMEGESVGSGHSADAGVGSGEDSMLELAESLIAGAKSNTMSKATPNLTQNLTSNVTSNTASNPPPPVSDNQATLQEKHTELEDRIVRECVRMFERTKGGVGMFFAYDFDITRSLQHKHEQFVKAHRQNALLADLETDNPSDTLGPDSKAPSLAPPDAKIPALAEPHALLPLWRRVDRQFWWNEWMVKGFVDAGLHSYVLPIMQGYFQIASFALPSDEELDLAPIDYIVISRRSRDRAGLRYQRRGVDDEARVANFVETETVVRIRRNNISNIFSYVQIRGSIPLFWTQTGYSMKPPPTLSPERTSEQNMDALRRHFQRTVPVYGSHTIVNLAEQHGKEGTITQAYREYARRLDTKDARYCEYDFHRETKGMKYENISKLLGEQERTFESQGFFWVSDDMLLSKQKGVYRVNCIDCLDRTNVVQSAFARHVLTMQLEAVGLLSASNKNGAQMSEADVIFNDVWANNGDAISRAYAGTSALKGDFTRTGKRDLTGLLNDGVNSLSRMYSATFSDWFTQAVIDYTLGYRTRSVFSEFLLKLQSTDPRELIRLSKVRAEAVATAVARVLDEGEPVVAGWTVLAPERLGVKAGDKFEEKVLLLSAQALYIVSYDYTLEKVKMYTRVPLGNIVQMVKGAYILSPLEEASRDPAQNAGFTVSWLNTDNVSTRLTSYSYRNCPTDANITTSIFSTLQRNASSNNTIKLSANASTSKPPGLGSVRRAPSSSRRTPTLSRIMSKVSEDAAQNKTTFAAFKVLPIDPARIRSGSTSSGYAEPADDLVGATTCKEVVDLMVDSIRRMCEDVGNTRGEFVLSEDIVSVSDAQRMTSVFAKMEYGVKRLLWL